MLVSLSRFLTDESKIRRLGINGLGMKEHHIAAKIYNNRGDIVTAAYKVLNQWKHSQEDMKDAYVKLGQALMSKPVDMGSFVYEALQ